MVIGLNDERTVARTAGVYPERVYNFLSNLLALYDRNRVQSMLPHCGIYAGRNAERIDALKVLSRSQVIQGRLWKRSGFCERRCG